MKLTKQFGNKKKNPQANQQASQNKTQKQYNYEFASSIPFQGMTKAKNSQFQKAAQNQQSQAQSNVKQNHMTEFGSSFAQKAYNAMSPDAKQGTDAVKNSKQYQNEFGTSINTDHQAKSKEAAKQMRNYQPKPNQNQNQQTNK